MVEEAQKAKSSIFNSYGAMSVVSEFLTMKEIVSLQQCSKHFYNAVVPKMKTKIELPSLELVLESARKSVSIGFWRDNVRQCS